MPQLRDFLERFRPAGTPGPAGQGAVPADRKIELETELAPLFELIAKTQAEADNIRENARKQATKQKTEASLQAKRIVDHARIGAEAVRVETAEAIKASSRIELSTLLTQAEAKAERLRARAQQLMPHYLDLIVDEIRMDAL